MTKAQHPARKRWSEVRQGYLCLTCGRGVRVLNGKVIHVSRWRMLTDKLTRKYS